MATLPTIANTYRVTLHWSGPGGTSAKTVMHFRRSSSTASAVATAVDANVTATMWNHTGTTTAVSKISVTPLDGSSATYELAVTGAKWAGPTAAAEVIPAGAAVITLRTANRGRRYRGRVFLPFVQENNIANGVIASSVVTALQTAWENFRAAMSTASTVLVVASYGVGPHGSWSPFATDVTSCTAQSIEGTVRRRQSRLRI